MKTDFAKKLDNLFNCFPVSNEVIKDIADNSHRTIQQNISRFCIDWILYMGTEYNLKRTDGRNEDSVILMNDLVKLPYVINVLNRPIPYV